MVPRNLASEQRPDDLSRWKEQLWSLWIRVFLAANKAAALFVAILLHKGLDAAAVWIVPTGWEKFLELFRGTFFVAFMVIYVHFLWEVLITFIPALSRRSVRSAEEERQAGVNVEPIAESGDLPNVE